VNVTHGRIVVAHKCWEEWLSTIRFAEKGVSEEFVADGFTDRVHESFFDATQVG